MYILESCTIQIRNHGAMHMPLESQSVCPDPDKVIAQTVGDQPQPSQAEQQLTADPSLLTQSADIMDLELVSPSSGAVVVTITCPLPHKLLLFRSYKQVHCFVLTHPSHCRTSPACWKEDLPYD